jgi:hypothetical protein
VIYKSSHQLADAIPVGSRRSGGSGINDHGQHDDSTEYQYYGTKPAF